MLGRLQFILNWSEVWALLIPLAVLAFRPKQPAFGKPVIIYLWIALALNLAGDIIGDFKSHLPDWLQSNNILYNIHSLVRFVCFSIFFQLLGKTFRRRLDLAVNGAAIIFLVINFSIVENFANPEHLSGNLLAAEAYVLLIYCMQYYLSKLRDESDAFNRSRDFWIVTGLSIYVVVNFFVFLFYVPSLNENPDLAVNMWNVHNVAYIVLCTFIAKAFYVPA